MSETIKSKYGFLAVGAAGGNIALSFYKDGYPSLFINASQEDLDCLTEIESTYKYHIQGGEGCNKNRRKSKELFKSDMDNILNEIKDKLQGIETLFIVGSSGGGNGSGIIPSMKRVCVNELGVTCCIITIFPDIRTESIKALLNAYEFMTELDQLEEDGATFILDNSKNSNKFRINEMFHCYLTALLENETTSKLGNLDRAEINELIHTRGMAIISKLGNDKADTKQLISTFKNNIYAPMEDDKVIKYIGLINSKTRIKMEDIYKTVGTPLDKFEGFESPFTLCCLMGLSMPYTKLEEMKSIIDENKDTIKRNLQSPSKSKLSNIDFFDDVVPEKPKNEKKASNRDLLFIS